MLLIPSMELFIYLLFSITKSNSVRREGGKEHNLVSFQLVVRNVLPLVCIFKLCNVLLSHQQGPKAEFGTVRIQLVISAND